MCGRFLPCSCSSMANTLAPKSHAMPHERRNFTRVLFDAPALLTTGNGTLEVHVLDLSLKGALIEVPAGLALPCGAPCQLMVPLAATEKHIAMSAEVAHVGGLHLGLLCRSLDLDSVTHLRRLIELQLGDPALLERDLSALIAAGPHAPGPGA